jgi:hypothetical protein
MCTEPASHTLQAERRQARKREVKSSTACADVALKLDETGHTHRASFTHPAHGHINRQGHN